jgi:hypothetical protein
MSKRIAQVYLSALFAALLTFSVVVLLVSKSDRSGLPTVITILAGGLIVSAVLPQLHELSIGPKGVSAKLQRLQEEIDVLKFLVSGYVTGFELEHLRKLANASPFPFTKGDTFLEELRRLWQHGLIKKVRDEWYIAQLPHSGDLKSYIAITKRGEQYLELLDQVQAKRANDEENHLGGLDT